MKLGNNLDFRGFEAQNMRLQNLAVSSGSPVEGQAYYDTTLDRPRIWDGVEWKDMVGAAGTVTGVSGAAPITSTGGTTPQIGITDATTGARGAMSAADKSKLDGIAAGATANATDAQLRDRSTHTGTQLSTTISDFTEAAQDAVGAAITAGTKTGITATYNDASNRVDLAVTDSPTVGGATPAQLRDRTTHTGAQAISTVTGLQAALDAKIAATEKGAANGVATLGADSKIPQAQLPALALTDVNVVASIAARDALTVDEGDVAIVTGTAQTFIYDGAAWQLMQSPVDGVTAVTGGTGITSSGGTTPSISITAGGVGTTQLADANVTLAKLAANSVDASKIVDGSVGTAELAADAVTASKINPTVAGNGLTGGGGTALAVGAGAGLEVAADSIGIADAGVTAAKLAPAVAGNGLYHHPTNGLAVGIGHGMNVSGDAIAVNPTVIPQKFAQNIGDAVATSFVITHNLNTRDVIVQVFLNSGTYEEVFVDVERTSVNTVTVRFATAPAAGAYRVVIHG